MTRYIVRIRTAHLPTAEAEQVLKVRKLINETRTALDEAELALAAYAVGSDSEHDEPRLGVVFAIENAQDLAREAMRAAEELKNK